nr:hypothetical protein Iba_scaffold747361CG0010 [Ipomoea batatas]GMC95097.1 hypothetical protein Iba_chr05cCG5240 [Ipomoea batatas]GMD00971.1 hypothetical protein Iba_chr05fCG2990 [Ipomoea batatas]GME09788.1 hypothetical protein Iba_scaffold9135CG0010 [Ipomoea batatas]
MNPLNLSSPTLGCPNVYTASNLSSIDSSPCNAKTAAKSTASAPPRLWPVTMNFVRLPRAFMKPQWTLPMLANSYQDKSKSVRQSSALKGSVPLNTTKIVSGSVVLSWNMKPCVDNVC